MAAAASKRPRLNGIVNRVKLVGIELEGGWDIVPKGEEIQRDGSVKFPASPAPSSRLPDSEIRRAHQSGRISTADARRMLEENALAQMRAADQGIAPSGPAYKGEIVSKPIPVEKIAPWVKKCYPTHVNETCGLHVHMSFHYRSNYARLMTPEFTPFIVGAVKAWAEAEDLPKDHPQWERVLKQNHHHCAHQYLAEGQIKMTKKDYESRGKSYSRYTFVNYCAGQHNTAGGGTVEVRGLSMPANADMATRAIMAVLDGTNQFLSKVRQRDKPERVTVTPRPATDQVFQSFVRAA